MSIDPRQRRILGRLLTFHDQPPQLFRLILRLGAMLAGWGVVLAVMTFVLQGERRDEMLTLSFGILLGFLGSGLASIRVLLSAWPVYEAIIDWSKAKSLNDESMRGE